ncbi:hypothetical protein KVJ73_04515 [Helicobacter pylori]|nr:hypothetical protein HMPREF1406_01201 [Helicobacter pylori GAM239Bi]EMJ41551.1 hypothetical protein HMPREF1433_00247 [Helicobacter pylori GAMchJs117Ai]WQV23302.1 hypothetical protein KVJ73_04515 [Helicobacter pylori]
MRKSYGAVSVDNVTIKSIKAKLGSNHYHKVISSFNTKNPFFIRQHLKSH